jgi:molybdate transport system permease protein
LQCGQNNPLGEFFAPFDIVFAFRWTGAALAAAVTAYPPMVQEMQRSLEAVDRRLEEGAGTLGARRFFGISLSRAYH